MNLFKQTSCIAALLLLFCVPAWAINKCTGPDGKVAYQDASCSTKETAHATAIAPCCAPVSASGKTWTYIRRQDEMTGEVACLADAPGTYASGPRGQLFHVFVQVRVDAKDRKTLLITTLPSESFHIDIGGTGVKTDGNAFLPIAVRNRSAGVALSPADELTLLAQLQTAKALHMRLRFWPWPNVSDVDPLSTYGYTQALALARECAKRI